MERRGSVMPTRHSPSTPPSPPTSDNHDTPRPRPRPSSSPRAKTWVPLFVSHAESDSPLITATTLPTAARREGFNYSPPDDTSGLLSIDQESDEDLEHRTPPPRRARETIIPSGANTRSSSPVIGKSGPRVWTNSGRASGANSAASGRSPAARGYGHVRKRSSASIVTAMPGLGVAIPGGSTMERLQSMTSFMTTSADRSSYTTSSLDGTKGGVDDDARRPSHVSKYRKQLAEEKRRVWTLVMRGSGAFLLLILAFSCLNLVFTYGLLPPNTADLTILPPWLDNVLPSTLHTALSLIETVPYPISTHPLTPGPGDEVTLADYLTTRLGSHFSVPLSSTPGHLWLTPASNASVRVSAPHLRAFVRHLDLEAQSENAANERAQRKSWGDTAKALVGSDDDRVALVPVVARRELVILCLDEGCLEYCRQQEWLCFGGYQIGNLAGERRRKAREMVKMMASLETLASGRRVFVVDGDVYFRDDPVPHMGDLDDFDIQIPDSWSSYNTKAGFVFLNPTANVISLWQRLLAIARIDDDRESKSWATTNILLDPTGAKRKGKQHAPIRNATDEFDSDAVASGYGQAEFESPWAGGMDVKVLDRALFRTSTGRLDGHAFGRALASQAIYFQCLCCEDRSTTDYIAGALGYHAPSVSFPNPADSENVPDFPMMITTPLLNGTEEDLAFAMGLVLQASHDTQRSFVPPLSGHIYSATHTHLVRERYIWRMFPAARWAKGAKPDDGAVVPLDVKVLEPLYVQHAIHHLDVAHGEKDTAKTSMSDLNSTLLVDPARYRDYQEFLQVIIRPFYSTARVIIIENAQGVRGKAGWELKPQFEDIEMCWEDPKEEAQFTLEGARIEGEGACGKHCVRKPAQPGEGKKGTKGKKGRDRSAPSSTPVPPNRR